VERSRRWPVYLGIGAAVAVAVAVVLAVVLVRNDSDEQVVTDTSTTSQPVGTSGTTETVPVRTAADDLDAFFVAADGLDGRLVAAAAAINDSISDNEIVIDQDTADLVSEAVESLPAVEETIPAGMEPELLYAVLLVHSDLVSRSAAMAHAGTLGAKPFEEMTACLRNGAEAAARFDDDVAALRTLAERSPPVAVAPPASRAAEDLAIRLAQISLVNWGCDSCGGYRYVEPDDVVIYDEPTFDPVAGVLSDGFVGEPFDPNATDDAGFGVSFEASYEEGTGWLIRFHAC
jgi:hypothetical protein